MQISVKSNLDALALDLRLFRTDLVDQATVSALNKTAAKLKTEASRQIREAGYRLKARDVGANLGVIRANKGMLKSGVRAVGKPLPLILFLVRATHEGVVVNIKGTQKLIRHAFVAKMASGHEGIFARKGTSRLPIDELYTIGVPPMFASKKVTARLQDIAGAEFARILKSELNYRLYVKVR